LQSTEINAQGIKAFAAHGDIAGLGIGRLKLSPIDWDSLIKAFGVSDSTLASWSRRTIRMCRTKAMGVCEQRFNAAQAE
jgi:hypothetical protein